MCVGCGRVDDDKAANIIIDDSRSGKLGKITLEKVRDCMSNLNNQVELDEELRLKANKALERMVEVAK